MVLLLITGCCRQEEWQAHAVRVEDAYAYLKAHGSLPDTIDLATEATWLEKHRQFRYAGEAYYVLGAAENLQGQDSLAMHHLKQAELCWQELKDAPDVLVGMTAYKQGRISENEMLPDIALYHYHRALPYLERAGDSLYLSSVYREIGRVTRDTAEQRICFARAWAYAESLSESIRQDTRYAILTATSNSSAEREYISQTLCDTLGMERYAAEVVRTALRDGDLEKAKHYLAVLARDTVTPAWSQTQYTLLYARYQYLSGERDSAYDALESFYREQLHRMKRDGAIQSYTVAERFDNASEREKNNKMTSRQRHLQWGLLIGIVLIILAIAVGVIVFLRLKKTVTKKQNQLKNLLLQHITQGRKLTNVFANDKDWKEFCAAFDEIYDGQLSSLQQQYPSLTTADLQLIALTKLGLDNSEICQLLNQSKRTVWNRRQRIKKHMQ